MAEGSYEYECERAELLGIDPPSRVDWEESYKARKEAEDAEVTQVIFDLKFVHLNLA